MKFLKNILLRIFVFSIPFLLFTACTHGFDPFTDILNGKLPTATISMTTRLAVGTDYALYIKNDGTVWAWGNNDTGQLGMNDKIDRHTPALIPGLTNIIQVATGKKHSLALDREGVVYIWGNNNFGQLGIGSASPPYQSFPTPINFREKIIALAGGERHSLALDINGVVYAWGNNDYGQLGTGNYDYSYTPVVVMALYRVPVKAIAAGYFHSMALATTGGTVYVWGENTKGQVGNDDIPNNANSPNNTNGLVGVEMIAAGGNHSLALKAGAVWAWGQNSNLQCGYPAGLTDTSEIDRSVPVLMSGINTQTEAAVWISGGESHTLVVMDNQAVRCCGNNTWAQLGDTNWNRRSDLLNVSGITEAVFAGGGIKYSMALKIDGTVWGWGVNDNGQLGTDPIMSNSISPTPISGLP